MNVNSQNEILKSKTLNLFQGKVQNDALVMPNLFRHLIWALEFIWHLNFGIWPERAPQAPRRSRGQGA